MCSAFRFVVATAIVAAGLPRSAYGGALDNFPPLAGWSRAAAFTPDDAPLRHGLLLDSPAILLNSPLVADIDGNLANGREVAIGTPDGILRVFGADGALRWQVTLVPPNCDAGFLPVSFMPTVASIFGDGVPYLLVGFGGTAGGQCDGGVAAFAGATGQLAWSFSTLEWQKQQGYPKEAYHGVVVTPAAADTDGDGRMEIAFGSFDRNFYLLEADGTVRWYYHAADTIWSSPFFAQLDDDPPLEVVTASDITLPSDTTLGGGYIQAFDTGPRYPTRIEFDTGFLWRTPNLGQVPYSSPALADVLPDEPGDEIVIGNGCYFPTTGGSRPGKWVKIFRARDGAELQTLDLPPGGTCSSSSPAVGDIDDDGRLEIVIANGEAYDPGGDGVGRIIAWDPEISSPKWWTVPYHPLFSPGDLNGNDESGGFFASPVIADLDGNGSLEVIAANQWSVHVLDGRTGAPLTCQSNACGAQPSMFAWGTLKSTPAIGDVDGDGALDVVIGGMHVYSPASGGFGAGERALVYAWTDFANLRSQPGSQPAYAAPWPTFRGRIDDRPVGGGGRISDVCLTTAPSTRERLRCRMAQLAAAPPCALPSRVTSAIARAQRLAAKAHHAPPRRTLRRVARALAKAQRLVGKQPDLDCSAAVQTTLQELIDLAYALAAAVP